MTTTSIRYIEQTIGETEQRATELTLEEIRERLGSGATTQDAQAFARLWNTRFFDAGAPVFYDDDDKDATWAEIRELLA